MTTTTTAKIPTIHFQPTVEMFLKVSDGSDPLSLARYAINQFDLDIRRTSKAVEIVASNLIYQDPDNAHIYNVPSLTTAGTWYQVDTIEKTCNCPDQIRSVTCKHRIAVFLLRYRESFPDLPSQPGRNHQPVIDRNLFDTAQDPANPQVFCGLQVTPESYYVMRFDSFDAAYTWLTNNNPDGTIIKLSHATGKKMHPQINI